MSGTPSIESRGGFYKLDWPDLNLCITVERIREDRQTTTAEITVTTSAPGVPKHLHQARINLLSTTARNGLAKHLASRWAEPDWDDVLEQACVLVLRAYREGEAVVEVGDDESSLEVEYQLWPLLQKGEPTIFFGDGGSFKSYLAVLMGVAVQLPLEENRLGLRPSYGNVLYLDYETDRPELNRRVRQIRNGLGLGDLLITLKYRRCSQPVPDDIVRLQQLVAEHRIDLVIIDSLAAAAGDDIKEPATAARFFGALRTLKTTSLIITHAAKDTDERRKRTPFGSAYWSNFSRSVYEVRKQQDTGASGINVGLYHLKCNSGALQQPLGFHITFDSQAVIIRRQDVADVPELAERMTNIDRIDGVLRQGALSVAEIASATGIDNNIVRVTCNQHPERFVKLEKTWGLKAQQA